MRVNNTIIQLPNGGNMLASTDSPGVFRDTIFVAVPLVQMALQDPLRLDRIKDSDQISDEQRDHIEQIVRIADAQPKLVKCHQTMVGDCRKTATRIIIPNRDGKIFVTVARVVCDDDACLQALQKRAKLESVVFPFSYTGLREFMAQYDDDAAAKRFARYLARSWGLIVTGSKYNPKALAAFFGMDAQGNGVSK
jgi:hypothetical protein